MADPDGRGLSMCHCKCDCGTVRIVSGASLRRGHSESCGCLARDKTALRSTKHGAAVHTRRTREYRTWLNMRDRCRNENNPGYINYGGRGIIVCSRWDSFSNFFSDMGRCPPGLTIDRINNDGNYEPSNCHWATSKEQSNNQRRRKDADCVTIQGTSRTVAEWGRILGLNRNAVRMRINRGWTPEQAVTTPFRWGGGKYAHNRVTE